MADPRIFVSYRRTDSADAARRLADTLSEVFGKECIFLDADNILPGSDFALTLLRTLRRCDVLVVIVGPKWVNLRDKSGQRRIDDPLDYVQMEIAEGLSRAIPIIPVLVGGASMPAEDELPDKIRMFHRRQAVEARQESFDRDIRILIGQLEVLLKEAEIERAKHGQSISVRDYFEVILPYQLRTRSTRAAELAAEVNGIVLFNVSGDEGGSWAIILDASGPHVAAGRHGNPDLTISLTDRAMQDIMSGRFDARAAVASGEVRLSGDLKLLPRVASLVFGG
ncbi:MAG: TIR domain-containing protein [Nitrospirae bacterium]|nr:TIR domain-containing protein [Nitrospirota bacterium]